jgi:hypothetical protein
MVIDHLLNYMTCKDLLPELTKERVQLPSLSRNERSVLVLDTIEARIMDNPAIFHTFITVLQKDTVLQKFASSLIESYRGFSSEACPAWYSSTTLGHESLVLPVLARYAEYLKSFYKAIPSLAQYRWPAMATKKQFNLAIVKTATVTYAEADAFTKSTLHGSVDDIFRAKDPMDLEDVVQPEGLLGVKRVLIEGSPGIGKSTLALELCKAWDEIESLSNFNLILLIRLKDKRVQDARTLSELLYHPDADFQQDVAKELTANGGDNTLLVLDGLDHLAQPLQKQSLVIQLLQGSLLPRASIVLTSRPTASANLLSMYKFRFDRRIEMLGFSNEDILEHAESVLGTGEDFIEFQQYLAASPAILSVMHTPLTTAIVVELYHEAAECDREMPSTMTEMYQELVSYLLHHYMFLKGMVDESYHVPENLQQLPGNIYQQFCSLAKLAYTSLMKHESIYKLPKGCNPLGFMSASPELYVSEGMSICYSFLHAGLQEYLAAFHLSQLPSAKQMEIFQKHSATLAVSGIWKYLAGILGPKCCLWELTTGDVCMAGALSPFALRCLYEAHEKVSFESVAGTANISFPQVQYGEEILPLDLYTLGACLAHSSCRLQLRIRLDIEMIQMLVLGLHTVPICDHSSSIETVYLRPPVTQLTMNRLFDLPPPVIHGLDLSHCKLDQNLISCLANVIPSKTYLEELDIRGNTLSPGAMVPLLHALRSLPNLRNLSIINTKIGCADFEALFYLVQTHGGLQELRIGDEGMSPECVRMVVDGIFARSSLKSLHLWLMDLRPSMTAVSQLLRGNSNLTVLEMHGCKIGSTGSKSLAGSLTKNITLEKLVLSMFDVPVSDQIGTDGALEFAEMLKINKSLENFELLFDKSIGRTGSMSLVKSLDANSTIKHIKIPQHYFSPMEVMSFSKRVEWSGS